MPHSNGLFPAITAWVLAILACAAPSPAQVSLQLVEQLGSTAGGPEAVSGDGRRIIYYRYNSAPSGWRLWQAGLGSTSLAAMYPSVSISPTAFVSISADLNRLAVLEPQSAVVVTPAGSFRLPSPSFDLWGGVHWCKMSADGQAVLANWGYPCVSSVLLWTAESGTVLYPTFTPRSFEVANGIGGPPGNRRLIGTFAADRFLGTSCTPSSTRAFLLPQTGTPTLLLDSSLNPLAISDDGAKVLYNVNDGSLQIREDSVPDLVLPQGPYTHLQGPFAMSGNARGVAGRGAEAGSPPVQSVFVWTPGSGTQKLKSFLAQHGADIPGWTPENALWSHNGRYVTGACSVGSLRYVYLVSLYCAADFNADGVVNSDDLGDAVSCYFSVPPCSDSDFNGDGETNADDLGDFITTYFLGC